MRLILVICFMLSSATFAADYKSAQRLAAGDVISADVFNDILDRIELTLKPVTISDLVGTWTVRQYFCKFTLLEQGLCNPAGGVWTHEGVEEDLFYYRDDIVSIDDNEDGTFSWTATKYQVLYPVGQDTNAAYDTGNITHNHCYISSAKIMACILNPVNNNTNLNGTFSSVAFMNVKRTSPDQIVLYYGPQNNNFNHLVLNKQSIPPKPPTALTASLSSGTVSLSWTASEGGATSYIIKAKTSATGAYIDVMSGNTLTTYSDSLSVGISKWYRVFAVNAYGTSIGSNVIRVNNPES